MVVAGFTGTRALQHTAGSAHDLTFPSRSLNPPAGGTDFARRDSNHHRKLCRDRIVRFHVVRLS